MEAGEAVCGSARGGVRRCSRQCAAARAAVRTCRASGDGDTHDGGDDACGGGDDDSCSGDYDMCGSDIDVQQRRRWRRRRVQRG